MEVCGEIGSDMKRTRASLVVDLIKHVRVFLRVCCEFTAQSAGCSPSGRWCLWLCRHCGRRCRWSSMEEGDSKGVLLCPAASNRTRASSLTLPILRRFLPYHHHRHCLSISISATSRVLESNINLILLWREPDQFDLSCHLSSAISYDTQEAKISPSITAKVSFIWVESKLSTLLFRTHTYPAT